MSIWEALPVIGGMFQTVRDIIRNFVKDPNELEKVTTEIILAVNETVKTEIGSRFWLASNWRAIVMLVICLDMSVKTIMGTIFDTTADIIFFGLLVFGLTGYRMDGRVLEFLKELFILSRFEVEKKKKEDKPE